MPDAYMARQMIIITGQATYATAALARVGAATEINNLNLGTLATLAAEFKATATLIIQTRNTFSNAVNSAIISDDLGNPWIDWRLA